MRMWWLHLGHTWRLRSISALYSTASQAGHLVHKPSGTERVRRSVLMRDGRIRSNQDMLGAYRILKIESASLNQFGRSARGSRNPWGTQHATGTSPLQAR